MGRMLDTLNRTNGEPPAPPAISAAPAVETDDAPAEEIPFIEVGAPARKVEASPAVWVASTVRLPAEPAAPKKPALQTPPPRNVTLAARPPMTVALQSAIPAQPARPRLAAEVVAYHQPDHAVSGQYRELLGTILRDVGGTGGRALLFAALTPGAGTTTAVLNLAVCAAAADPARQVVVVDANLVRPAVAKRLGLAAGPGLQEVLAGTAALEQVVQQTAQERLFALPAGAGAGRLALLGGAAGGWLLRWLRERFDLVLLDGAAWPGGAELADLAAGVDAVYLVLDDGQEGQPAVRAATRSLAQFGARLGGLIVTR
jgi:Mrp family chromosome partitioning ATPase